MSPDTFRPRTFTELVDASFALFRDQFAMLTVTVAVMILPVVLLRAVVGPGVAAVLLKLLERALYGLVDGAVVLIVSERLLGRRPELAAVMRTTFQRWGSLLVSGFLRAMAIGIGFLLLVVPGIWATAAFFAMPIIVMLEDTDGSEAGERSMHLAKDNILRILGVLIVGFVLLIAWTAFGGWLVGLMGLGEWGVDVVTSVLLVIAYPLPSVMATLLYYDLRIRKEGFDLEVMAAGLPGDVAIAPALPRA